jgi:hypothetical protein
MFSPIDVLIDRDFFCIDGTVYIPEIFDFQGEYTSLICAHKQSPKE